MELHYYFYHGKVFSSHTELDNSSFEKLSAEMVAFYLENKEASKTEIQNCMLSVSTVIDIDEYRNNKLNELQNLSLSTSDSIVKDWQIRNALLPDVYEYLKASEIIAKAAEISKQCINEYDRVETLINASETIEEIDIAFNGNTYSEMK